jgi:hypothetical protein
MFEIIPDGESVPNVCVVIGVETSQAHKPVSHMITTPRKSVVLIGLFAHGVPVVRQIILGRTVHKDATTTKLN